MTSNNESKHLQSDSDYVLLVAICNNRLQQLGWLQTMPSKDSLLVLHTLSELTRNAVNCREDATEVTQATSLFTVNEVTALKSNKNKTALAQMFERLKELPEDDEGQLACLPIWRKNLLDQPSYYPDLVVVVDVTATSLSLGEQYKREPQFFPLK